MYEGPVQDLIDELGRLPGIGPKSAQRIAFHLLDADKDEVQQLVEAITTVKTHVNSEPREKAPPLLRMCSHHSSPGITGYCTPGTRLLTTHSFTSWSTAQTAAATARATTAQRRPVRWGTWAAAAPGM